MITIIARTRQALTQALHRQGFSLVADLPARISISQRRGMLIARVS
jgi:hypothetical protein